MVKGLAMEQPMKTQKKTQSWLPSGYLQKGLAGLCHWGEGKNKHLATEINGVLFPRLVSVRGCSTGSPSFLEPPGHPASRGSAIL